MNLASRWTVGRIAAAQFVAFVLAPAGVAHAATPVEVVLMTPLGEPAEGKAPHYATLDDPKLEARIRGWMDNEATRLALRLYGEAWEVAGAGDASVPYYVAVVPGGNHADRGFVLVTGDEEQSLPDAPFILLDEQPFRFEQTLLHETGHMVLDVLGAAEHELAGGYVFHTTPAVIDRWTAFNEGFAIHLETLYSERASVPGRRAHHDNRVSVFGAAGRHRLSPLDDLRTLAQTRQRYTGVRDNRFAHPAAYGGDDLLRHAADPERDLSRLRNASQLLACEGFAATVFYRLVTAASPGPSLDELDHRLLFEALHETFSAQRGDDDHLWLLYTLEALSTRQPTARGIFLDLSRAATVTDEPRQQWPALYAAALRVDVAAYGELTTAFHARLDEVLAALDAGDATLHDAVGPEIWVCAEAVQVLPQMIDERVPLCIDLNAADGAELRALPGAEEPWVARFLGERDGGAFGSLDDVRTRTEAPDDLIGALSPVSDP